MNALKRVAMEALYSPAKRRIMAAPTPADFELASSMISRFLCPITKELMVDPVLAPDGHTYDRKAIIKWCVIKGTCPLMPNVTISVKQLIPNRAVKHAIMELMESGSVDDATTRVWHLEQDDEKSAEACFAEGRISDAAFLGHAGAQGIMASRYYEGEGVTQDFGRCVEWAHLGALNNDATSQFRLGYAYHMGEGVEKNWKTALQYYEQAFANKVTESAANIAIMYYEGGPELGKDTEKVLEWGKECHKNKWVSYLVAKVYYDGVGAPKDFVKARQNVQRDDSSDAKFMYGRMMVRGEGGPKNVLKGIRLIHAASRQGNEEAKTFIAKLSTI